MKEDMSKPLTSLVYASTPMQYSVAAAGTTAQSVVVRFTRAFSSMNSTCSPVSPASNMSTTTTLHPSTGTPTFPRCSLALSQFATVTRPDILLSATLRRQQFASSLCHSHAITFVAPALAAIMDSSPDPAPMSSTLAHPSGPAIARST